MDPNNSLKLNFLFPGGHGQAVCPSVMRQRQAQTPQRQGLCSSSGRTRAQELSFGLTQQIKYPKNELGSGAPQVLCHLLTSWNLPYQIDMLEFEFRCVLVTHTTAVNMFLYDLKIELVVSWAISGSHLLINVNRTVEMTHRSFSLWCVGRSFYNICTNQILHNVLLQKMEKL